MRTFCFCTTEFGDSSGGEVFNIPISLWYFVYDYTTTPTNPALPPVQIHLHPLMISAKNCWHRIRHGGRWGGYLDETGPQSGHGPKGQSPIHFKVVGCVCMLGREGGQRGIAKEAYTKASVHLMQANEKE